MVTHKEALQAAIDEFYGYGKHIPESLQAGMEAAIRAYLDARGLVMVPKALTHEMEMSVRKDHEGEAYLPYSLYAGFLAAAPDPFGDAP